ncbi:MAG TPA: VWA domain-containing protein [Exilispira sp.]|nr:VWA domain-containing protein [Exilispira sp.]
MTNLSFLIFIILLFIIGILLLKHYFLKSKIKKYNNKSLKILYLTRVILLIIISLLLSLTFTNYKAGLKKSLNYSKNIDNIILLDFSTSMLANDLKPTRFELAKSICSHLIENSSNCRFALILFGDDPLLEVPLTENIDYLKSVISTLQIDEQFYRSSNISLALTSAIDLLEMSPSFFKNIILISDYDFDQILSSKLKTMITDNVKNFYNIVVSSEKGSRIWLSSKKNYLLDNYQNEVFTKSNLSFILDISKLPNSSVYYWDKISYNSVISILNSFKTTITSMEKHETYEQKELKPLFGLFAIIFMLIYIFTYIKAFQIIDLRTK